MRSLPEEFHAAYYNSETTWKSRWLGLPILQCPLDLMVYQQLLWEYRPKLVVQTGVHEGGSLLFLATILEALGGEGRVIGIDLREPLPENLSRLRAHPRITFLHGSSADPAIVKQVAQASEAVGPHTLFSLDSDHRKDHVLAELAAYAPLVSPGGWLVLEDTNINGHPVCPEHGPGPREALDAFLAAGAAFEETDRGLDHLFSFHSWLRRIR